jgi:hypothetical protein
VTRTPPPSLTAAPLPRLLALAILLLLAIFPARAVLADNRVRILFDDASDTYRPNTRIPNPPTDGCRPAVDDADDNGCVTQGEADDDGWDDEVPPP